MGNLSVQTVGVFVAQLDDAYQIAVWRGIESRARELGVGIVCFVGHRIDSPIPSEAACNVAYRLADRRTIDALVVISSAIATSFNDEVIARLFPPRGLPQVSVGLKVPEVPSVTVDGCEGMRAVVSHLIQSHGKSRFALIRGPAGHPEAEQRERAVRSTLHDCGLELDEAMTADGSFLRSLGRRAASDLLARGRPFDALVCVNDLMALGAMEVLREAAIRVPQDVAVVGFDGIEEGRYVTPPLTTVMQPLDALGRSAIDCAVEVMQSRVPQDRVLTGSPVIRQSCGCAPKQ
ncbi:MAG TPA: substrate-binding domain-containing protein, partial [Spirochaetia bacterium]|nr:substrate-binding domain-containing protein [Spirochaetia bacterium]